ncbi:tyrosine-type recombinase/integrase [Streptomonospora arabica]|uniref:Tyrosine-type recombinase/integrase n=1 Tax=Streptomonospora arabica TaxID=412417 RepID=A0ABV9SJ36_9ACTN
MAHAEQRGRGWRVRYQRLDGTWGSRGGFETKAAALAWGQEQEAQVRAGTWIDPKDQEITFGAFTDLWWAQARLADNTRAKYRSYLDAHILPQWRHWPLIAVFNHHLEIQGWANRLHEELAESTVSSVFALFSTICHTAVRARRIPANPCNGIRVSSGEYAAERHVATPAQVLRAALRLHHSLGRSGFVLCLMDAYTGARWSELVGLQPHEYDEVNGAIAVHRPLRETGGKLVKAPRTKTPAGKRWVQLPPFLDQLYRGLLAHSAREYVFTGAQGGQLRRGAFRARYWRPAFDGRPGSEEVWLRSPILPGFTFNEGRHTHRTWLADDGIPEVGRAARLGHRMPGMADVYEHVTPETKTRILEALTRRWENSLTRLDHAERRKLALIVPELADVHYRDDAA